MRMPGLSGPEFHLRATERFVFLTGDTLASGTRAFLAEPGRVNLAKPFGVDEVSRLVSERLRATAGEKAPQN
jgi:hypothetical protein